MFFNILDVGVFNEIGIYETKIEKQDEIETLMKEITAFYLLQPGVIDVKYISKRIVKEV